MRSKSKLGILLAGLAVMALMGALAATPVFGGGGTPIGPTIVSALGVAQVDGQDVIVDVIVQVPAGANANDIAREALAQQGARPLTRAELGSNGFTLIGDAWDVPVVQNYNPGSSNTKNEPSSLGGRGKTALTNTHATWDVATSLFEIDIGADTDADWRGDAAWLFLRRQFMPA